MLSRKDKINEKLDEVIVRKMWNKYYKNILHLLKYIHKYMIWSTIFVFLQQIVPHKELHIFIAVSIVSIYFLLFLLKEKISLFLPTLYIALYISLCSRYTFICRRKNAVKTVRA